MSDAMHVVDLGGEKQLADVGEDGIPHYRSGEVLGAVDRRCDAAGVEAFRDGDEFDHRIDQ